MTGNRIVEGFTPPFGTPLTTLSMLYSLHLSTSGAIARIEDMRPDALYFCVPEKLPDSMLYRFFFKVLLIIELHAPLLLKASTTVTRSLIPRSKVHHVLQRVATEKLSSNFQAAKALAQGAAAAVVSNRRLASENCHYVPDTKAAFLDLAAYVRFLRSDLICVGITGSCGKTSTKELTANIINRVFKTVATFENGNTFYGVARTMFEIDSETKVAVVEISATSLIDDIGSKCNIVQPNIGLITNIGHAHLEGFRSLKGVLQTKRQLYDYIKANGGVFLLNEDDPELVKLTANDQDLIKFGRESETISGRVVNDDDALAVELKQGGQTGTLQTQLFGAYNLSNILAAAAIASQLGISFNDIKVGIETYIPKLNRSQFLVKGTTTYILDAYNANPTSMNASLDSFASLKSSRKIAVLGHMLELGRDSKHLHQAVINKASACNFNEIVLVGREFSRCELPVSVKLFDSVLEAKQWLAQQSLNNTHILLKGSHKIGIAKIAEA